MCAEADGYLSTRQKNRQRRQGERRVQPKWS